MNPLTLVKRIQNINSKEASLGISEEASWHAVYKESAYVYVGGIPFDLTEGDLLAVFAQYGEIVDVNLVRDKGTGKSKGFAFVAYEDQRSTVLAVDNLNGAQILGRTIRVDHVSNYKKKEEEDEELRQQKREERGVCRAFQRGECTRGDGCKFSHNEQRAAHTGWGPDDQRKLRRADDKADSSARIEKRPSMSARAPDSTGRDGLRLSDKDVKESRVQANERWTERHHHKRLEPSSRDPDDRGFEKRQQRMGRETENKDSRAKQPSEERSKQRDVELDSRDNGHRREEKGSRKHEPESSYHREDRRDMVKQPSEERSKRRDVESNSRDNGHRREEKGSRKHEPESSYHREDRRDREKDKRTVHEGDASPRLYRGTDIDRSQRSRR